MFWQYRGFLVTLQGILKKEIKTTAEKKYPGSLNLWLDQRPVNFEVKNKFN